MDKLQNLCDAYNINKSAAYFLTLEIYKLRTEREWDFKDLSFRDWCNWMYENEPYDDYE